MTRDDIIRMAREAGLPSLSLIDIGYLEKFAALVAAAEREVCAKVCDALVDKKEQAKAASRINDAICDCDDDAELRARRHELTVSTYNSGISKCAAAIRARSEA